MIGTYKFADGEGSTYKTIQVLPKGTKLVKNVEVNLGWATIIVSNGEDGEVQVTFNINAKANTIGINRYTNTKHMRQPETMLNPESINILNALKALLPAT